MADWSLEEEAWTKGRAVVAGVDEAGRGPLAGPVAAAAVILPRGFDVAGLDDSKKLSAARRERLYRRLTEDPGVCWGLAFCEADEIDRLNILRATHRAMQRAVESLGEAVDFCLVDGLKVPGFPFPHLGVVKGDARSVSIAAASIIAKVSRDRRMVEAAREFPAYGFERHKGYGTKVHLEALRRHGPCRIHRRSFQPVAQRSLPFDG
jgi:ribonuclease HII